MSVTKTIFHLSVTFYFLTSAVDAIIVDDVHLSTNTNWVVNSPAHLLCEISTEEGENVTKVLWYLKSELVYLWLENETIEVFGPLVDRVEIPANKSSWNLKINRLAYELEGEFTCEATNNELQMSSKSFHFILFYNEGATYEALTSLETCQFHVQLNLPATYPRPIGLYCKMYLESNGYESEVIRGFNETGTNNDGTFSYEYNTTIWFADHPTGSYLKCTKLIYGSEVEFFTYLPEQDAMNCPNVPEKLKGFTFDRANSTLNNGCLILNGYKVGAEVTYRCDVDGAVKMTGVCQANGTWSPDVTNDQISLPTCGGACINFNLWLFSFSFVIVLNSLDGFKK
ncbi:uncharacterized protein LOC132193493 [Neocloeon triangulifer]|uniref:uncharacterized protein LOC132193493 n=1 Tax=Neocloeon triangulifer TaxID=2078957 RepID=UPI00286EB568|nr:uncharacterized protein LOC132193493 [Neocloeon triangulifer]